MMLMVEVDIGIISAPLHPIIQVVLVDYWVYLFMFMIEVDMGRRPATFLYITMMEYTLSAQGSLNNLFQGVCEEKISKTVIKDVSYIYINIILIILIQ